MDSVGLQSAANQPADYNNHLGENLNSEPTQYLLGSQRENNPTLQSVLEDATFTMDVFAWGVKYHYIKPDGNLDSLNPDMMKDWKFTVDQIVQNINQLKNLNSSQLTDLNNLSNTLNGLKEIKSMDEFMYKISPAYAQLETTISHLGFWRKSATQINPEFWEKVTSTLKEGAASESSSTKQSGSIFDVAAKSPSKTMDVPKVKPAVSLQLQLDNAKEKLATLGETGSLSDADLIQIKDAAISFMKSKGGSVDTLSISNAFSKLRNNHSFPSNLHESGSTYKPYISRQIGEFLETVEKNSLGNVQSGTAAVAAKSNPALSADSNVATSARSSAGIPASGRGKISNAALSNPAFTLPVTSTSNVEKALGKAISTNGKGEFTSMTLNVRTADANDIEAKEQKWPKRAKEIVNLINQSGGDFINLQEVDNTKKFPELGNLTQAEYILNNVDKKYGAVPAQPEKGLLMFYNKNNFKPVENEFRIEKIGFDHEGYVNNVDASGGLKSGQYERRIIGQLFEIRGTEPKRYMFQADLHGPHDDAKIVNDMITKLKNDLQTDDMKKKYGDIPINIMGDFNMNPYVSNEEGAKTGLMRKGQEINGAKISTQLSALANEVTKPIKWPSGEPSSGQNDFQISLTDNINLVDGTTIKTKVSDHFGVLVKNELSY